MHIYCGVLFFSLASRTTSVLFSAVHTKVLSCMSSDLKPFRMALEFLGYLSSASVKLQEWTFPYDASVIFIPTSIPWSQWKNSWGSKTRTSPCHLKAVTGHNFLPPICCIPRPISLYGNQSILIFLSHIFMMLGAHFTTFSACIQYYHYYIMPLFLLLLGFFNWNLELRFSLEQ